MRISIKFSLTAQGNEEQFVAIIACRNTNKKFRSKLKIKYIKKITSIFIKIFLLPFKLDILSFFSTSFISGHFQ